MISPTQRTMIKDTGDYMRTKAFIREAQKRYEKKTITRKILKLHNVYDADILEKLDEQENVTGYLKNLIRNDIKKQG